LTDSLDSHRIPSSERFAGPLTQNLFHKLNDAFRAALRRWFLRSLALRARRNRRCREKNGSVKNAYFIDVSALSQKTAHSQRRYHPVCSARRIKRARKCARCGVNAVRVRSIMRKCFNFSLASVIRLQCSRFPRALIDIHRHCHQWLGGQHGEEAKDEGEGGGEKGREEDQAPEEEVSERRFTVFDFERTSVTASNGPARVEGR
jgi:hypothetical protein